MAEVLAQLKKKGGGSVATMTCRIMGQGSGSPMNGTITFNTNSDNFKYNKVTCTALNNASGLRIYVDSSVLATLSNNQSVAIPSFSSSIMFVAVGNQSGYVQSYADFKLEVV